jgi:ATP adenylyltransferase
MKYIESNKSEAGCVFCNALSMTDGEENLVIARGELAYVIVNRYPYTSGHLMIVPLRHESSIEHLDPPTRAEMMELTNRCMQILRRLYTPQGFNVGINIGEAAGAGIVDHVHIHIVPRWEGDTNFMSSLGNTRVLPESLEDTYRRVRAVWSAG